MSTTALVIIIVAALICIAALVLAFRAQTRRLQSRFGPEYERSVHMLGRSRAEAELQRRERRVRRMQLRPLSDTDRNQFVSAWRNLQAKFVDDPVQSLAQADALLADVMKARGYPASEFDECAANLSVNHGVVVNDYREGHRVAVLYERGTATTEDIRQALVHYRALLDDLLAAPATYGRRVQNA
jgi:hypothetical protein